MAPAARRTAQHAPPGVSGAAPLCDADLLATLLAGRRPAATRVATASNMLRELGGLSRLAGVDRAKLRRWRLGKRQTAALLAALELARRLAPTLVPMRMPYTRPRRIVRDLWERYGASRQEMVGAAWLDGRRRLIWERVLVRGKLQPQALDARQVVEEGLERGASGIVLFHFRPAGEAGPTPESLALSRSLLEQCEQAGIDLVDHLVIRSLEFWVSLRDLW